MPDLPVIALVGAPHTGAQALALALQQRIAPHLAQIIATSTVAYPAPALTLLMGLDLGCPANEELVQEAADAQLRTALHAAGIAYQVIYGGAEKRINNSIIAIKKIAIKDEDSRIRAPFDSESGNPAPARQWALSCEKCSDAACEHRLFTALTGLRPSSTHCQDPDAPSGNPKDFRPASA